MDKIHLREISCQAHIGVTEEERTVAQRILLDLILHLDLEPAAQTDDLEKTVDYRQSRRFERSSHRAAIPCLKHSPVLSATQCSETTGFRWSR